jgi:anti-sigma factor RsiW
MEAQEHNSDPRQLWSRFTPDPEAPVGDSTADAVDPNDLAAYVEGRAEPLLVERTEVLMRQDPQFLEEVIELRRLHRGPVENAPAEVVARAIAAGPQAPTVDTDVIGRIGAEVGPALRWWMGVRWTAAAAVVILACFGGFTFGQGTFAAPSQTDVPGLLDLVNGAGDPVLSLTGDNGNAGGES